MDNCINLGERELDFATIQEIIVNKPQITLSNEAKERVRNCRKYLDKKLENSSEAFYGINTGFGFLQNVQIDATQIEKLQHNLLLSHACGLGDEVPQDIIKLMLFLKIQSLLYGNSGIDLETIERLVTLFNQNILPVIYTQGSLGASGDLAPLSHLALPLIGEGEVYYKGQKTTFKNIVKELNWKPLSLKSKEGLALINGTQFMSSYGIFCLHKARHILNMTQLIAALSFDAFDCVPFPLHEKIHSIRNQTGQIKVAENLRNLLKGSVILLQPKSQVQDPYSFRCIPQVIGASLDAFEYVLSVFMKEINGVTDNPNIFPDEDLILSGGNFHGQPLAITLDFLSIAMSEIGNISERRTYQLISGQRNLPLFLVSNPGLNSGFMIPQYTAAGIVSENKQLCTPSSVDSIPSSNNQEDHVSMGANAAVKCFKVIENIEKILSIELLTAAQALHFRRPQKSSTEIEKLIVEYRKVVSFNEEDRLLHNDLTASIQFFKTYTI
jgi:histidine ammonia-lyase